jgi:hypothetical protein
LAGGGFCNPDILCGGNALGNREAFADFATLKSCGDASSFGQRSGSSKRENQAQAESANAREGS